jgi:hypothetical protein
LENRTDFGSASDQFRFTLTSRPKSGAVSVRFAGGRIEVSVPQETLYHWANSEEVGIYAGQQTKGEVALTIAIEKISAAWTEVAPRTTRKTPILIH